MIPPLKARSFSDTVIANLNKYNLEYTNNVTKAARRRVRGFLGIEAVFSAALHSAELNYLRICVPVDWDSETSAVASPRHFSDFSY